jgi:aryl-phospho-beta-D-glucosidase BglC (GH1 family)
VVEACAAEGIYTILDMHTFPGGQNQGWHSDSGLARALFWENKDLQDRGTKMWVEIANRYAGNSWVCAVVSFLQPELTPNADRWVQPDE